MRPPPRPRVLLADDYQGMLTALGRLLTPSCEIVGLVADGARLIDMTRQVEPDVVVVDLFLPEVDGLAACGRIKADMPRVLVIVVSATDDPRTRARVLQEGASAFIPKAHLAQYLLPAIQRALALRAAAPGGAGDDAAS
jgi:CheY-like chemotaxis protein